MRACECLRLRDSDPVGERLGCKRDEFKMGPAGRGVQQPTGNTAHTRSLAHSSYITHSTEYGIALPVLTSSPRSIVSALTHCTGGRLRIIAVLESL